MKSQAPALENKKIPLKSTPKSVLNNKTKKKKQTKNSSSLSMLGRLKIHQTAKIKNKISEIRKNKNTEIFIGNSTTKNIIK